MYENKADAIDALEDLLKQCDHFCADALTKYIHKRDRFDTSLSLDNVCQMQSKIRIGLTILKKIKERINDY